MYERIIKNIFTKTFVFYLEIHCFAIDKKILENIMNEKWISITVGFKKRFLFYFHFYCRLFWIIIFQILFYYFKMAEGNCLICHVASPFCGNCKLVSYCLQHKSAHIRQANISFFINHISKRDGNSYVGWYPESRLISLNMCTELKTLEWDILNPDRLIWVSNVHTFDFILNPLFLDILTV